MGRQGYIYMVAAQYRGLPAVQPIEDLNAAAPRAPGGDPAQVVRQVRAKGALVTFPAAQNAMLILDQARAIVCRVLVKTYVIW